MKHFEKPSFEKFEPEFEETSEEKESKKPGEVIEQKEEKEKEPKPEKTVLLIRHPSVEWLNKLLEQAELEGKDIETYVPVDVEGLKMTRLLSEYLQTNLSKVLKEKELSKKFTIYTSPIKRAESEADIVSKNLKLAHLENPEIPIPKNNEPINVDYFAEIPWISNKQDAEALIKEAKQKGVHPVKLWFEKEPDEVIKRLNEHLPNVEKGLEFLEASDTPVDIVFTHRITLALMLWFVEEKNKGREDLTISREDLPKIMELTGKIAYTSISEIRKLKEDEKEYWQVHSIAETPHLDKEKPELKKGTF